MEDQAGGSFINSFISGGISPRIQFSHQYRREIQTPLLLPRATFLIEKLCPSEIRKLFITQTIPSLDQTKIT